VTFVTYGGSRDRELSLKLNGIGVSCNRWGLPQRLYVGMLPWLFKRQWEKSTVLKSVQVWGSEVALGISRRFGKKFVARCGYLLSDFVIQQKGEDSNHARESMRLEKCVFTDADRVVVTTERMSQTIRERYGIVSEKIRIIPNFVDTDRFRPPPRPASQGPICFVGRLERQKNLSALLQAVSDMDVELQIIGDGSLRSELEAKTANVQARVKFMGNVPQERLPGLLGRASLFVLPSFIEGHPKALLEAMSCGLPCIGTDVPGTSELIRHGETGYLCGLRPEEIRDAIATVIEDRSLGQRLGRNAREAIERSFSLVRVVGLETEMLEELAG
jgi:glycosyltransferase involved in cell wall biosynthesis